MPPKDIIPFVAGRRFGHLVTLADVPGCRAEGRRDRAWLCRCDCGKETFAFPGSLLRGRHVSCGCQNHLSKIRDLAGQRFGRLVVLGPVYRIRSTTGAPHLMWRCRCDCGEERVIKGQSLTSGAQVSCRCYNREHNGTRTHGGTFHPEYRIWLAMKQRCGNPKNRFFPHYGGRGIVICERWLHSYGNFIADMGRRPSADHSIERDDVNGPYSPENCRWATMLEQRQNTRKAVWVTYLGETKVVSEWARVLGINKGTLANRLEHGWSVERAFTEPPRKSPPRKPAPQ